MVRCFERPSHPTTQSSNHLTTQPSVTREPARSKRIEEVLPLLPVRENMVIFPYMMLPLLVGRERSVKAVEEAHATHRTLVLVAQKNDAVEDPMPEDLFAVGTVGELMQMLRLPDGNIRLVVEGLCRVRIVSYLQKEPYYKVRVQEILEPAESGLEIEALMRQALRQFEQIVQFGKSIPPDALITASNLDHPGRLGDIIASYLDLKVQEKQEILEIASPRERLLRLNVLLARELKILEFDRQIENKVREEVNESQKEYYLRERLKVIQEQLGERDSFTQEIEQLRQRVAEAGMTEEAQEKALKEIDRLEKMPPVAPEVVVIRTYLDWLLALPWNKQTPDHLDIKEAEQILDEDHYGLKKVKERVLEFLAVRQLTEQARGPILCFIGPPGVGKTSIGKSIARAMGRKFIRLSLGGVRDEAEIRGHRRTYIGSMPGRILQTIRRIGTKNPVFMLDEIDMLGLDFRGDPSAALLEALDPEQNNQFSDHYIEVPFDLSQVMFIATGNILDPVPYALKDRLEVIEFPGYIEDEKMNIARQFLVPKQIKEHGLTEKHIAFGDDALRTLIREYTREAGVRNLEREIASLCRKVAKNVASGQTKKVKVTPKVVAAFLGPRRFHFGVAEEKDEIAVATGLVWSELGGDIISIEVGIVQGKGKLILTGHMGEVMQESAEAAITYSRMYTQRFGVNGKFADKHDIHIHVPAAAIPKDGPSAGIAMVTAMVSALLKTPVRKDVAMTGEVTLRGKVLPIGGVKEKILAAHRAGIKEVILPKDNEKDLEDIPPYVRRDLKFHFVRHMDEVLQIALADGEALRRKSRRRKTPI
ncbi:MAG: endopeptidase La [Abditibacteriales bacterium]|nr:endopeptidase La [Abditibacteriales bacterium]MDW8366385.1 endopeptidase La [Abditibacteriales bacterium]